MCVCVVVVVVGVVACLLVSKASETLYSGVKLRIGIFVYMCVGVRMSFVL